MSPSASSRWLFGPLPDLLLGCGGAYVVVFALLAGAGDTMLEWVPAGLMPLLVLLTSIPHYGATLLRVYGRDSELRRYRVFALWLSLLVYAWFVVGVYDRTLGSWMLTLYMTWSPWHYSGQNYGIALMFLGRRGVSVDPGTKRWLYASFGLSFALAFLGIHTAGSVGAYAPGALAPDSYSVVRLGIPLPVAAGLLVAVVLGYGASLCVVAVSLLRVARPRDLAPAAALVALQALWFSIPVLSRATGVLDGLAPFAGEPGFSEYAFLWVAIGHAVQYLWVTTYYAKQSDPDTRRLPYFVKAVAAGGAIFGLPLLFFGPDALGVRGYDAGLALMIASAVNLQHFILDGAIWKLRDGRIARVLLREREPDPPRIESSSGDFGRHLRWGLLVLGLVYAASFAFATLEVELGVRRATEAGDFERMAVAARRLRWVGRDDAGLRHNLAVGAFRAGDVPAAREQARRSLALQETARAWVLLGLAAQREQDLAGAAEAYERALAVDAGHVPALTRLAAILVRRGDRAGAREALRRAIELAPDRADLKADLAAIAD